METLFSGALDWAKSCQVNEKVTVLNDLRTTGISTNYTSWTSASPEHARLNPCVSTSGLRVLSAWSPRCIAVSCRQTQGMMNASGVWNRFTHKGRIDAY